jgi:hypothetical protein
MEKLSHLPLKLNHKDIETKISVNYGFENAYYEAFIKAILDNNCIIVKCLLAHFHGQFHGMAIYHIQNVIDSNPAYEQANEKLKNAKKYFTFESHFKIMHPLIFLPFVFGTRLMAQTIFEWMKIYIKEAKDFQMPFQHYNQIQRMFSQRVYDVDDYKYSEHGNLDVFVSFIDQKNEWGLHDEYEKIVKLSKEKSKKID